jgi:hypothetical protein
MKPSKKSFKQNSGSLRTLSNALKRMVRNIELAVEKPADSSKDDTNLFKQPKPKS